MSFISMVTMREFYIIIHSVKHKVFVPPWMSASVFLSDIWREIFVYLNLLNFIASHISLHRKDIINTAECRGCFFTFSLNYETEDRREVKVFIKLVKVWFFFAYSLVTTVKLNNDVELSCLCSFAFRNTI